MDAGTRALKAVYNRIVFLLVVHAYMRTLREFPPLCHAYVLPRDSFVVVVVFFFTDC